MSKEIKSTRDVGGLTFIIPRDTEMFHDENGWYHKEIQPEVGGSWHYGQWTVCNENGYPKPAEATWALIDYTGYSDYSGSTVERSNYEALLEDYPNEYFCEVFGGHGTQELMIPILNIETTDDDSYEVADKKDRLLLLYEALDGLTDYPLYDEEHHSQLKIQLADEAWDIWVEGETIHDLTEIVSDLQADHQARMIDKDNTIDRYQYIGPTHADIDGVDQEWLREKYYELTYKQNYGPECENAVSAYFPFHKEVVQELFNMIVGADNDRT